MAGSMCRSPLSQCSERRGGAFPYPPTASVNLALCLRPLAATDLSTICSWVTSRDEMQKVCGDDGDRLTPRILHRWLVNSLDSFVLSEAAKGIPLGFCTLSHCEAENLPDSHVELCHLLVDPRHRYSFVGSHLCQAAKDAAVRLGFFFLCGRIVPGNRPAQYLATSQRFSELKELPSWAPHGFRWFAYCLCPRQTWSCLANSRGLDHAKR